MHSSNVSHSSVLIKVTSNIFSSSIAMPQSTRFTVSLKEFSSSNFRENILIFLKSIPRILKKWFSVWKKLFINLYKNYCHKYIFFLNARKFNSGFFKIFNCAILLSDINKICVLKYTDWSNSQPLDSTWNHKARIDSRKVQLSVTFSFFGLSRRNINSCIYA